MAADHQGREQRSVVTLLVAAGGADKSPPLRFCNAFSTELFVYCKLADYLYTFS